MASSGLDVSMSTNRIQSETINGKKIQICKGIRWCPSGGSVLGPIPFLIYINDLPNAADTTVKLLQMTQKHTQSYATKQTIKNYNQTTKKY